MLQRILETNEQDPSEEFSSRMIGKEDVCVVFSYNFIMLKKSTYLQAFICF
jgi:hypothetical protein